MNREKHLLWAKHRAVQIIESQNNPIDAFASFASDMNKHDELKNHDALKLGMIMCVDGRMKNPVVALDFINGVK